MLFINLGVTTLQQNRKLILQKISLFVLDPFGCTVMRFYSRTRGSL